MKKLILGLVTALVGLAIMCAYLASQLAEERGRTRAEASLHSGLEVRLKQVGREQPMAAEQNLHAGAREKFSEHTVPALNLASDQTRTVNLKATGDDWRASRRKMLAEPAGRELLRAQQRAELHAADPDLARVVGLTTMEYDRLLEVLADQALQRMELFARTDGAPAGSDNFMELRSNQQREVADLLGEEKAEQYEKYAESAPVRHAISEFHARLNEANTLRDEQSERLVTTLQEQRAGFAKELEDRYAGHDVTLTMDAEYGGRFIASGTNRTSAEEQIFAQMDEYNLRLTSGAASVLTQSQLEVFTHIREEQLARQRVQLQTVGTFEQ